MLWFKGSIPEAIVESRKKGLIFIVYIEGDNEETQKMNTTWADSKIAETLSREKCIAVKLDHKSEDCSQFSKLYPVVFIPVTYFIGENGLPVEVIGGSLPVEEFLSKANKALEAHQKSRTTNINGTTAASSVPQSTAVASSSVQHSSDSTVSQAAQDASTSDMDATPGTSQELHVQDSGTQQTSLQDKVDRAKELIEKKRQEKDENEKQDLRKKEFERRHFGQEMAKAKRNREEKQAQDIVNQIKEDRAKERAHREAVRQQISRDKAEREARKQNELQERQRAQAMTASSSSSGAVTGGSDRQATKGDCISARLQFRLPDGSSVTNSFSADSTLDTIRQFISNHLGSNTSSVTLYTTYPRRELTEEDLVKSLSDLGLAPSATLVVALISRDKAEREARKQNELQERQRAQAMTASSSSSGAVTGGSDRQATKKDCISARLQFRLPDGSSVTNSFSADSTLDTIRQFISIHLGSNTSSVTLYTTYPRQELTEEDLVKSLSDLGLAPSATLVVALERAHREAVRQQISRDKAEREARKQNELQERQRAQAMTASSSSSGAVTGGSDRQATKKDCISARLQFRLPDGSSVTNSFSADSTLDTIRQFISIHLGSNTSSVTLYTTYPRRELTEEDLVKSLSDLGLAPSATLVVALTNRNAVMPSGSSSSQSDVFLWILSPLFALISFIKAFLFGSPDQPRGAYGPTAGRQDTNPQSQQSNSRVRRRVPQGGASFREEGGVYRLNNEDDEDDDNNTWNGNSTQQM
ncbi:UBX domain-containing protein 4-like isoform X2 [Montipora foliosa]|uniref:UBX domain-containing protein 4-like isoform X2 n=1 Tax=Montipora foliosa TaxID=591990 RepID=UPI0035F14E9B